MFIVKDERIPEGKSTQTNDTKTAVDIVLNALGIPEDESAAQVFLLDVAALNFGEKITFNNCCTVACVRDSEIEGTVDFDIAATATELLGHCTDDYASRIWNEIQDAVIRDMWECSGLSEGDGYASGDVALAIGRALCDRLGIEI